MSEFYRKSNIYDFVKKKRPWLPWSETDLLTTQLNALCQATFTLHVSDLSDLNALFFLSYGRWSVGGNVGFFVCL